MLTGLWKKTSRFLQNFALDMKMRKSETCHLILNWNRKRKTLNFVVAGIGFLFFFLAIKENKSLRVPFGWRDLYVETCLASEIFSLLFLSSRSRQSIGIVKTNFSVGRSRPPRLLFKIRASHIETENLSY